MTIIEQAAANYIAARDAKAEARKARNAMRCQYAAKAHPEDGDPGVPVCRNSADKVEDYCDNCKQREILHAKVKPFSVAVASAFGKLRRIVHKSNPTTP